MAQIVYLDVDDEITSAATRIRDAAETRVALVVPYGSRLATSRINFRLLAREAQSRGRMLSVVAGDAATRALAASAGLPVFGSVGEYERADDATTAGLAGTALVGGADGIDGRGRGAASAEPAERAEPAVAAPPPVAKTAPPATRKAEPDLEATAPMPVVAAPVAAAVATSATSAPAARGRDLEERVRARPGSSTRDDAARSLPAWPFGRTAGLAALGVLALAVLALGVGAYLLLPSADITIATRTERIGPVPLEIRADPGVSQPDPETGIVPAQRLTFDVAVSDTFATTGKRVEEEAATGRVTFRSKDPTSENRIAAGSIVSTPNGIRFATTAAVNLPRATIVGLTIVPGEASVGVEAVAPGPEGNVEANAITVIPAGEDPTFTEVRNGAPTAGGLREEFPRIVQADVDAAIAELRTRLDAEFEAILADPARVPDGLTLFPQTRALGEPLPTTDPTTLLDQEVPEYTLGLGTTGTVIAVDEAPVEALARQRVSDEVDDGYQLVEGSIELDPGEPQVAGETITFPVDAAAAQIRLLDADALRAQIKGKPVGEARTLLAPYGEVEISVWPEWVTAIPTIDGRVSLEVVPPAPDGASPSPSRRAPSPTPASTAPDASGSVDPGLEGEVPPP